MKMLLVLVSIIFVIISCSETTKCEYDIYFSSLEILAPLGEEVIEAGSNYNINWHSTGIRNIRIEYSIDNGKTWHYLVAFYPASENPYPWIVPDKPTSKGLIRLVDSDNFNIISISSKNFSITSKPYFYLKSPKKNDVFRHESRQLIRWESNQDRFFNLYYYNTLENNWSEIDSGITGTGNGFYKYEWLIPEYISGISKIKLSLTENNNIFWISETFFIKPKIEIPEFVEISGGVYLIGSSADENSDEYPQHSVYVSSFYISPYLLTQEIWIDVMGSNPSFNKDYILPVENLTWFEAIYFCNELSKQEGMEKAYIIEGFNIYMNHNSNGYRLPTEAEWEIAASGGNSSLVYSGSNNPSQVAWFSGNSNQSSKEPGLLISNDFGLYDMSGNVWEFCWDDYNYNFYQTSSFFNPYYQPSDFNQRIIRGGSWYSAVSELRVTNRNMISANQRSKTVGFRLVRSKTD